MTQAKLALTPKESTAKHMQYIESNLLCRILMSTVRALPQLFLGGPLLNHWLQLRSQIRAVETLLVYDFAARVAIPSKPVVRVSGPIALHDNPNSVGKPNRGVGCVGCKKNVRKIHKRHPKSY